MLADGHLEQVTTDDSWAATILAQDPKMRPEDVAKHPMRNVLINVLGGRPEVDIHLHERELKGGEILLLCSDGVHGVLGSDDLTSLLQSTPDPEAAAGAIVRKAIDAGSRDNLTALVVSFEADK